MVVSGPDHGLLHVRHQHPPVLISRPGAVLSIVVTRSGKLCMLGGGEQGNVPAVIVHHTEIRQCSQLGLSGEKIRLIIIRLCYVIRNFGNLLLHRELTVRVFLITLALVVSFVSFNILTLDLIQVTIYGIYFNVIIVWMMFFLVVIQIRSSTKSSVTEGTNIRLFACVDIRMDLQIGLLVERFCTVTALI